MSQCVPSWDTDDYSAAPPPPRPAVSTLSDSSNSLALNVPSLEYEVAELTWKNGQLAMHGLAPSRVVNKPPTAAWEKPRAGGTLESIVNQATTQRLPKFAAGMNPKELVPWFDNHRAAASAAANSGPTASASLTVTMDALVPCRNNIPRNDDDEHNPENSAHVLEYVVGSSTHVGSCSGAAAHGGRSALAAACGCKVVGATAAASESATFGGRDDSFQVTLDTCGGLTSTSMWSPENTSSGKEYSRTSAEDHDYSGCRSRSQSEADDCGKRKLGHGKSSVSIKKTRAAAIHNQSERKRRDKINQRMKTLQKLVPNSSKTDKASMLDEVIEYLKQLQAQVQMMSRMNIPSMILPLAMQQQLQMSMMGMGMGTGIGMGMGGLMDINTIGRAAAMPPPPAAAAAFMPMAASSWDIQQDGRLHPPPVMSDPLSAFFAGQSQPMTIDAYSRLAAFYQQFQQISGSKN
ncbi:hypothetical protein ABFS82_14G148700 [Erythranthe guttata]